MRQAEQKKLIADLEQIIKKQKNSMALLARSLDNPTVSPAYWQISGMVDALDAVKRKLQGDSCFLNIWK